MKSDFQKKLKICFIFLVMYICHFFSAYFASIKPIEAGEIAENQLRILALGDSTMQESTIAAIQQELERRIPEKKIVIESNAKGGTSTTVALANLENEVNALQPHIVVSMLGLFDFEDPIVGEHWQQNRFVIFAQSLSAYNSLRNVYLGLLGEVTNPIVQKVFFLDESRLNEESSANKAETEGETKGLVGIPKKARIFYFRAQKAIKKGNYKVGIRMLRRLIKNHPNLLRAYEDLIRVLMTRKEFEKALEVVVLWEKNYPVRRTYNLKFMVARRLRNREMVEDSVRKIIEYSDTKELKIHALIKLADYYIARKWSDLAVRLLEQAELEYDSHPTILFSLAKAYKDNGDEDLYIETQRMAEEATIKNVPKFTSNYREIARILQKKGVQLFAMQYPLRTIDQLRFLFEKEFPSVEMISNRNFIEMVTEENYRDYFKDRVGGNFGHTQEPGDRLIAKNVARVVVKWLSEREE